MERPEPRAGTLELGQYADGFVAWLGRHSCSQQAPGLGLIRHFLR